MDINTITTAMGAPTASDDEITFAIDCVSRDYPGMMATTMRQTLHIDEPDEALAFLRKSVNVFATLVERGSCAHCGHGVHRMTEEALWTHDQGSSRGCRAASFDRDGMWDDTIDKKWSATV